MARAMVQFTRSFALIVNPYKAIPASVSMQ